MPKLHPLLPLPLIRKQHSMHAKTLSRLKPTANTMHLIQMVRLNANSNTATKKPQLTVANGKPHTLLLVMPRQLVLTSSLLKPTVHEIKMIQMVRLDAHSISATKKPQLRVENGKPHTLLLVMPRQLAQTLSLQLHTAQITKKMHLAVTNAHGILATQPEPVQPKEHGLQIHWLLRINNVMITPVLKLTVRMIHTVPKSAPLQFATFKLQKLHLQLLLLNQL